MHKLRGHQKALIMDETNSINRNSHSNKPSAQYLVNKVVLLVGDDAGALQSLAGELAVRGVDIALASSQLSADFTETIRMKVMRVGGRFLMMDKRLVKDDQKIEAMVEHVKSKLGKIDILIDISSGGDKDQTDEAYSDISKARWWLSSTVLNELTS
jgi:enoyl-[acyl-carrier-protein] reductase (NADH)